MGKIYSIICLLVCLVSVQNISAQTPAQTTVWFTVAHDGDSISIPVGTVTQYGVKAGTPYGCGTGKPPLATDVWVTPKTLGSIVSVASLGVVDPAFCYVKELDVVETSTVQTITVNGKSVTVPALPVIVVTPPPVIKTKIGTRICPNYTETYYSDGSEQLTATCTVSGVVN